MNNSKIEKKIQELASNFNSVFVFPSSITAKEWMIHSLDITDIQTLPAKMFIAWDTFKEEYFCKGLNDQVYPELKKLFVNNLIENNQYYKNKFTDTQYIVNILPQLQELENEIKNKKIEDKNIKDYLDIKKEYETFLKQNNLYEPSWQVSNFNPNKKNIIIVYPEIILDFYLYEPILKKEKSISFINLEDSKDKIPIQEFTTSRDEIDYCISEIEDLLLNEKVPANEIAIHCYNLDELKPYIKREFEIRGISVDIHSSIPYKNNAIIKMLFSFNEIVKNNWSFSSLKKLILNKQIPFSTKKININELLKLTIKNKCIFSIDENIVKNMKKFKTQIENIVNSKSFNEIYGNLDKFQNDFLETDNFSNNNQLINEKIKSLLIKFSSIENNFKSIIPKNRFEFFISSLKNMQYTPPNTGLGINIFESQVAAGIPCKHQFVLNAGEKFVSITKKRLSFLSEDLRDLQLNLTDENISDYFFTAYLTNQNTKLSYSKKTFTDFSMKYNNSISPSDEPLKTKNKQKKYFQYQKERNGWESFIKNFEVKNNQQSIFPNIMSKNISELTKQCKDLFYKDDQFKITASNLNNYANSSKKFFLQNVLKIKEQELSPKFTDNQKIGSIYHKIAELLYTKIMKQDKIFKTINLEKYKKWAEEIIDNLFLTSEDIKNISSEVLSLIKKTTKENIFGLLRTDCRKSLKNGYSFYLEQNIQLLDDEILYIGNIDRIECDETATNWGIIDYKKSTTPSISNCWEKENQLQNFQIAIYILLVEHYIKTEIKKDDQINFANFYNFKNEKYNDIFNNKSRAEFDKTIEVLKNCSKKFKELIEKKDFASQAFGELNIDKDDIYTKITRENFIVEGN